MYNYHIIMYKIISYNFFFGGEEKYNAKRSVKQK